MSYNRPYQKHVEKDSVHYCEYCYHQGRDDAFNEVFEVIDVLRGKKDDDA